VRFSVEIDNKSDYKLCVKKALRVNINEHEDGVNILRLCQNNIL
jgi:hypothetical protein